MNLAHKALTEVLAANKYVPGWEDDNPQYPAQAAVCATHNLTYLDTTHLGVRHGEAYKLDAYRHASGHIAGIRYCHEDYDNETAEPVEYPRPVIVPIKAVTSYKLDGVNWY